MQLLYHFMHRTWAYTELGVFGGSETSAPWTLSWLDTYAEHRSMCKCIHIYLISQLKVPCHTVLHDFTCGISLYLRQIERTRADQRNYSIQIQFDESMGFEGLTYRGMGEGLLRGTWVILAAALPKKKTLPQHGRLLIKTCITRVPWTTCAFLYHGRIASFTPIACYLYNYLPSFMKLTVEVDFSKKIHKKPIS